FAFGLPAPGAGGLARLLTLLARLLFTLLESRVRGFGSLLLAGAQAHRARPLIGCLPTALSVLAQDGVAEKRPGHGADRGVGAIDGELSRRLGAVAVSGQQADGAIERCPDELEVARQGSSRN